MGNPAPSTPSSAIVLAQPAVSTFSFNTNASSVRPIALHIPLPSLDPGRLLRSEPAKKRRKVISSDVNSNEPDLCDDHVHTFSASPSLQQQQSDIFPPITPFRRPRETPLSRSRRRLANSTPVSRPRRHRVTGADVSTAASAAAAVVVQNEVNKPREERSLTEFHPDIALEQALRVISHDDINISLSSRSNAIKNIRASPGKPRPAPIRTAPLPTYNSGDRLNLHKPRFRRVDIFSQFEQDRSVSINYVDKSLASVGYQETDLYSRPLGWYIRQPDALPAGMLDPIPSGQVLIGKVEYDMDIQDVEWLSAVNEARRRDNADPIRPAIFEIAMTLVDREWHDFEKRLPRASTANPPTARARSSSATAVKGDSITMGEEQDSKCAICDDGDCENSNAIVFCDGCDMAVHQECYGVPFIPEGQWLCRKCQLIGRPLSSNLSCIFCPNQEGALKQTGNFKWAHLLCALWIPEITLGNTTFMEPVLDVQNIPTSRWKLNCYICNQKMGACIQCSSKNCFTAFHVTCARRAGLYLQMKSPQGSLILEQSSMSAYCDRHCPTDWVKENDVSSTLKASQNHYNVTMKDRQWRDSREAALISPSGESFFRDDTVESDSGPCSSINKKKLEQALKLVWRLPSGAPIIPSMIFERVNTALSRYPIKNRKRFVAGVCKYWTLKRESRRGAALLKRLPAHQSGGSSADLLKRDFSALGPSSLDMLRARIDFAEQLEDDLDGIAAICEKVQAVEEARADDILLLQTFVDTLYFPIIPLLGPILKKASDLDPKHFFLSGFLEVDGRIRTRYYTSVYIFARDVWTVFCLAIGVRTLGDVLQLNRPTATVGQHQPPLTPDLSLTVLQKEKRTFARRIFRTIFPMLQDAWRKERDIMTQPEGDNLVPSSQVVDEDDGQSLLTMDLGLLDVDDDALNTGTFANPGTPRFDLLAQNNQNTLPASGGDPHPLAQVFNASSEEMYFTSNGLSTTVNNHKFALDSHDPLMPLSPPAAPVSPVDSRSSQTGTTIGATDPSSTRGSMMIEHGVPTPVPSSLASKSEYSGISSFGIGAAETRYGGLLPPESDFGIGPLAGGGVPWYLHAFDPHGTTVHFSSTGQCNDDPATTDSDTSVHDEVTTDLHSDPSHHTLSAADDDGEDDDDDEMFDVNEDKNNIPTHHSAAGTKPSPKISPVRSVIRNRSRPRACHRAKAAVPT